MIEQTTQQAVVRLIASDTSWIEGEAIRQLNSTSALSGMQIGVGLPDLHPGRGTPIGAAFFSTGLFYPYIAGNDVGCGIGLWQTSLKTAKVKRDKWAKKLADFHLPWEGDIHAWLRNCGLSESAHGPMLGTIGSGNHFAELQRVERVHCQESFTDLGLNKNNLMLLVHSGSRGIGEALLRSHTDQYGAKGLEADSKHGQAYLAQHDFAVKWARCNRSLIARRFMEKLRADSEPVLDICHNSIEMKELGDKTGWLHRKGAAQSDRGAVVIPGSRGELSYLVQPTGDQDATLSSLPHGAGRKWNRKSCKGRLKMKWSPDSLTHTPLGSVVICDDNDLLYEEAPQAYKNIETVIHDVESAGLIKVIASLRPLITYKRRSKS